MTIFSKVAFSLQANCTNAGHELGYGHAQQLLAAALGYSTLASYQQAQGTKQEEGSFHDVLHVLLDRHELLIRAHELKLPYTAPVLMEAVKAAFVARLPRVEVHITDEQLVDAIRAYVDNYIVNHGRTSGEIAMTNGDGLDEVYLPIEFSFDDIPEPGKSLDIEVVGQISMGIDTERPYSGHQIDVRAMLLLERVGKRCVVATCELENAKLDWSWAEPPKVSMAEALAEELDLDVSEAEELVDVEPLTLASDDDLVYGYEFDFSEAASPVVVEKIMAKYNSLQVTVGPNFFDNVEYDLD